jgi:hypothetical protein
MDERDVEALLTRIVRESRIPWRRARADLRRELASHFEAAGDARAALRAFGDEAELIEELRRVYRRDWIAVNVAKLLVGSCAALAVAIALQLLVNLRFGGTTSTWHLSAGFRMSAVTAGVMVLCLITAWGFAQRPFESAWASGALALRLGLAALALLLYASGGMVLWSVSLVALGALCHRLRWRQVRWPLTVLAFALAIGALHGPQPGAVDFRQTLLASAGLAAAWLSIPVVFRGVELLFAACFDLPQGESP